MLLQAAGVLSASLSEAPNDRESAADRRKKPMKPSAIIEEHRCEFYARQRDDREKIRETRTRSDALSGITYISDVRPSEPRKSWAVL